jgi:hypothetical protein
VQIANITLYFDGEKYVAICEPVGIPGVGKCPQDALLDIAESLAGSLKNDNLPTQDAVDAVWHWLKFEDESIGECLTRLREPELEPDIS